MPQDESLKKVQSNSISIVAMYDENDGGGQRCRCYERLTFATKKMHSPQWSLGFFFGRGGGSRGLRYVCVNCQRSKSILPPLLELWCCSSYECSSVFS